VRARLRDGVIVQPATACGDRDLCRHFCAGREFSPARLAEGRPSWQAKFIAAQGRQCYGPLRR
jgi:hypothetical protein